MHQKYHDKALFSLNFLTHLVHNLLLSSWQKKKIIIKKVYIKYNVEKRADESEGTKLGNHLCFSSHWHFPDCFRSPIRKLLASYNFWFTTWRKLKFLSLFTLDCTRLLHFSYSFVCCVQCSFFFVWNKMRQTLCFALTGRLAMNMEKEKGILDELK